MDNAPHVHVLRPIIAELGRRGHKVEITARDFGQTLPLLKMYGLKAKRLGRHRGKNKIKKYLSFSFRSIALLLYSLGRRFDAVLCHGARAAVPSAKILDIPLVLMGDYEHAGVLPKFLNSSVKLLLVPDIIPTEALVNKGIPARRIIGFPGLKEDLYVHDFKPDQSFLYEMGMARDRVLVLVRPPATMAHYAVQRSSLVFSQVLEYLCTRDDVQVLLLSRTDEQQRELAAHARMHGYRNIFFPTRVYHGPSLIWFSDMVISGGGTMNREAAALGVPVVSIYQGPLGSVDRHLINTGKLMHVSSIEELRSIPLVKSGRNGNQPRPEVGSRLCEFITDRILEAVSPEHGGPGED